MKLQYHQSGKMSIELLDTESEGQDTEEESSRKYSSYVDRFINPGEDLSEECRDHLTRKPVFLPRSIRSYNNSPYGKMREMQEGNTKKHENGNNDNEDSSENEKSSSGPGAKKELFGDKDNVFHEDNLQCKFNPRNFKILYVINSENCFYRRLALTRAKNVSLTRVFNNHITSVSFPMFLFTVSQSGIKTQTRRFRQMALQMVEKPRCRIVSNQHQRMVYGQM